jgi:hypothetical protein
MIVLRAVKIGQKEETPKNERSIGFEGGTHGFPAVSIVTVHDPLFDQGKLKSTPPIIKIAERRSGNIIAEGEGQVFETQSYHWNDRIFIPVINSCD